MIRRVVPVVAVVTFGLGASAPAYAPKPAKITRTGVGKIQLGASYKALRKKVLLSKKTVGCEVASPPEKSAHLVIPLSGTVTVVKGKISQINVFSGATVGGISPGSSLDEIKAAFPDATVDSSALDMFGAYLVRVSRSDGGPFTFVVPGKGSGPGYVAIPHEEFCE